MVSGFILSLSSYLLGGVNYEINARLELINAWSLTFSMQLRK